MTKKKKRDFSSTQPLYRAGDELTLTDVGLGKVPQLVLFLFSLFPFVGLAIGSYYASQNHFATRGLGRILLTFAIFLHFIYICIVCPTIFYLAVF